MRLSQLCKTAAGGTPLKSKKEFYEGGDIPWLLSGEVNNNNITTTKKFITRKGLEGSSAKIFPKNTVVIAMYGATAGEVGILRIAAASNQAVCGIHPDDKVLPEYLYYFFLNHKSVLVAQAVGNAQPNISQEKIKNTCLELPPIPEQQRIVAILDQAFAQIEKARANAEQNLKNARELSIASIKEILMSANNTELLTIDQLTDVTTDYVANGSFASLAENVEYKREKDYAVLLRLVDHSSDYKKDFVYINQHAFNFLQKSVVKPNDIVLSNVGARLGTAFRAPDLGMPMSLGPNSILIKATEYGDYLYCWLQSAYGQAEIMSIVSGAGQPKFNKTQFRKLVVPVPKSESERADTVEKIRSITRLLDHLEIIYASKLNSLDELKKSLLKTAFSGELTNSKGIAA